MRCTGRYKQIGRICGLMSLCAAVHAEDLQPDPAWQQGILPNGLQWNLLATPQRPSDPVIVSLVVNNGLLTDKLDQTPFSTLTPRLLLSRLTPAADGPSENISRPLALVSCNDTEYRFTLPAGQPAALKTQLKALAETLQNPELSEKALPASADASVQVKPFPARTDRWWRYRTNCPPFPTVPPAPAVIDGQALTQYYQKWYTPDAMTLYIVGNVDNRLLPELINRLFVKAEGHRERAAPLPEVAPLPAHPVRLSGPDEPLSVSLVWDQRWQPVRTMQTLTRNWEQQMVEDLLAAQAERWQEKKAAPALTMACQILYQRQQCALQVRPKTADPKALTAALRWLADRLVLLRDEGLSETVFNAWLQNEKNRMDQAILRYAQRTTTQLLDQQLRARRHNSVIVSPERYQALRRDFLQTLTLERANALLHRFLTSEPVLVAHQPEGTAPLDVDALAGQLNALSSPATAEKAVQPTSPSVAEAEAAPATP